MKTLRFFGMALFAVLMCVNFTSCSNKENDVMQDGEKVIVSLGFGGDYEISESPLSRNTIGTNDLYYISVSEDRKFYAHGLFNNLNDINIELTKGKAYSFFAIIVKDGINKLYNDNNTFSTYFFKHELTNEFSDIVTNPEVTSFLLADGNDYDIANVEAFLGNLNYTPKNNDAITIYANRLPAFGAEFIAEDFTEGKLLITLETEIENFGPIESPRLTIEHPTTSFFEIFTVVDGDMKIWKDKREGSELVYSYVDAKVNIFWVKDDGTTILIGQPNIPFRNQYKTTIKFKVDKSTTNGIIFDIDESTLSDGDTYIVDGDEVEKQ